MFRSMQRIYTQMLLSSMCMVILCIMPAHSASIIHQDAIDQYYLAKEGKPLWVKSRRLNKTGKALLGVLEQSWMNGLNPDRYHVNEIKETLRYIGRNSDEISEVELMLTDAYILYARDISGMRVNAYDVGLTPKHWKQSITVEDALLYLDGHKGDIAQFLLMMEPQANTYQRLKNELTDLIEEAQDTPVAYDHIHFAKLAVPGRGYNDIPKLRTRLGITDVEEENYYTYDPELVHAVKVFQEENGLKPDGLIGTRTLLALNQTRRDKINKLIVNMERLRWVADEKPNRFIVVNIPSATLWAIEEGQVAFEMPVVIGRKKRETLSFVTTIHGVRFNPTWTVPPTIKKEDIVPQLIENPGYLADKGMELYDGYGKDAPTLDPSVVDWANITESEMKGLRMVQIPGAHNPLGRIRVLMPNSHNIYLHDTNDKSLFWRADRAKSSGCVRLKDPEKVAEFVMKAKNSWNEKSLKKMLDKPKTSDIYTSERMPVYLLYYTTWIGDKGQIVYGYDVYDKDRELLQLIEKLDGIPFIRDNNSKVVQIVD